MTKINVVLIDGSVLEVYTSGDPSNNSWWPVYDVNSVFLYNLNPNIIKTFKIE